MRVSRRRLLVVGLALTSGRVLLADGTAWAADSPAIIDCADWDARPPSSPVSVRDQRPVKILVHHTATPNAPDGGRGAALGLAHGIQNFHMDVRGWLDTGQHFTISRGGYVLEGRHRSLDVLREGKQQVEGAHCTGQNIVAIGIENEGTYLDVDPPSVLWDRLRDMCAYVCQQYDIAPTQLYGHRDFKDTQCPGDRLYGRLPDLRAEVAEILGRRVDGAEAVLPAWPLLHEGDSGPEVRAAQRLLGMPATGEFDGRTGDAVRAFQAAHRTEEVNGLVGGETWPLLVGSATDGDQVLREAGMTAPPPPSVDPA